VSSSLGCCRTLPVGMTVGRLIAESGIARRDAELLTARALGRSRAYVLAHMTDPVAEADAERARQLFERRRSGTPIAYVLQSREFYGLELRVTQDVLIPRPETELLVDLALSVLEAGEPRARLVSEAHTRARVSCPAAPRVLDVGTGSGAIALAVAANAPRAAITATDVSRSALAVARENAARHGLSIDFVVSDGFAALGEARFDVVISNPPYVAADDPHLSEGDVRHEPRLALVGGEDGLDLLRMIAAESPAHLVQAGWLLFEHGYDQAHACRALLEAGGFKQVASWRDLAGVERVSGGQWRGC